MFFTQEDYRKIERWLLANSRKDTDFVGATTPLKGNETVVLVQDGKNVKTSVKDIVDQFFLLGVSDFLNITDKYGESYISIDQAIQLIPFRSRKVGQVITFIDEFGNWAIYQFQGKALNQWNNTTLWIDLLAKISGIPIIDSEDIITKVDDTKQASLYLADKQYNEADYSGLGRIYLRKNIQTIIDPSTGKVINVNLLTQSMLAKENTIYIIQYDYNLNNQTITIPEGCVLDFQGGTIYNGLITGKLLNSYIRPEWFKMPSENDYFSAFKTCEYINNDIVLSKEYLVSGPINFTDKNIIFENNSTLKLTEETDTFVTWGHSSDDTTTSTGVKIYGKGTIDGNFLTNTVFAGTRVRRCKISDINIKNSNHVILRSTLNSGSLSVNDVTLTNEKPVIGSIGLYAESADSTYIRLVIIDTSIGISQNSGNNKYFDVHHWLSFTELWEQSITIDAYALGNTYIACEADSVRTFFKCSSDYMKANIIAPVHYRNEKIITDDLVALYPPLLIEKNDYKYTYINVFGGNLRFLRCDYQIVNKDSVYDCILTNSGTGNINQNTPDKLSILQSSFQPFENAFNLTLNKNIGVGAFKVETTEDMKLYSKPMWWNGSMWIAADGYPITNKRVGLNSEKPNPKENNIGLMYFSTSLKRPFFSDGEKYVDAEGFSLATRRGGTNDRPSTLVPTDNGKLYFDTSLKQTIMYLNGEWVTLEGYPLIRYLDDYSELPTSGVPKGFRTLLKIGDRIVPIYFTGERWIKSDGTLALFKYSGNTSERPNNRKEGECFFDTTLNKPIWWNGTKWVDSNGSVVNMTKGTTEQRPTLQSIDEGFEYYDSTLKKKILWNGSGWVNLDGTALA